jgi:hypothetical protein
MSREHEGMEDQERPDVAERIAAPAASRKAYDKPVLQVYGDLTEITKSMMAGMMDDGSGHPNMHFTS